MIGLRNRTLQKALDEDSLYGEADEYTLVADFFGVTRAEISKIAEPDGYRIPKHAPMDYKIPREQVAERIESLIKRAK